MGSSGSSRNTAISLIVVSLFILTASVGFASVPGIIGQDEGGTGNSPVSFNIGEGSEMSGGHKVNVNVTTGNLTVKHTDLVIPTKAGNIVIERTYNSLKHLNGVEKGLDVTSPMDNGGWDPNEGDINVSPGVVWINGERVVVAEPVSWPLQIGKDQHVSRIIYVENMGGGMGTVIFGSSANGTDKYIIGSFSAFKDDEHVLTFSLSNSGQSINTGVEYGANITVSFNSGSEDDYWTYTLQLGAVRIKDQTYQVNGLSLGTYLSAQTFRVVFSPGDNFIANATVQYA